MRRNDPLKLLFLTLLLILSTTAQLYAAGAKRGWTKVELSHVDGSSAPVPSALLARFNAERIGDYGAYTLVYAPKGIVTALEAQAAKENIRVRVRDELDVLQLPGASLDTREGISGVPADKLARQYAAGKPGVFVVQFTGALRAEWMDELRAQGWTLSRYIPNNGYLVVGTPELVAQTRKLSFVQWLDAFHPYQKAAFFAGNGRSNEQLFELGEGAGAESAIAAIRAAAEGEIEVQRTALDTRVFARMSDVAAEALLRHEMILSVSPRPTGQLSDERQVMSLTSNLSATQSQPTSPTQYWNWITSRCAQCSSMSASVWKVGVADSGLDNGANFGGHPDLNGRKFFGGTLYGNDHDEECAPGQLLCDAHGHGTLVAGIAAGKGAGGTGFTDSGGYYLGQGVAQTGGVFSTKIFSLDSNIDPSRLFLWASDAANAGVTIQNHSWNQYSLFQAGTYSTVSRDYDIATRDADGTVNFSRIPILFSISSGNHDQGQQNQWKYLTLPGATAKNVLSVGALENYRPNVTQCAGTRGDSYQNIMRTSRVGTGLAGYIKPDVMAPGSLIVSAHTSVLWPTPSIYCFGAFDGHFQYSGTSGTSFSAPVGAGAALLVKRYLGAAPTDLSPALTRAVLIAGARSVRGGEDRTHDPVITTIGPIPSQQQGFGRLTLDDILNNSQKPVVFDQAFARTFTTAGQSFSTTLRVRDASKPVKIALVWTDTPAAAFAPNPLVNDLNLEVRRSSNSNVVYVGNSLSVQTEAKGEESVAHSIVASLPYDHANNVEFSRLFLNSGEDLTITVKAWNIAGDTNENANNFEQDFALAVLNADVACDTVTITQQPQSTTIQPGQSATLTVVAGGTGPFNYQWYRGTSGTFGSPVCGNSASCIVSPVTTTSYWVQVSGACATQVASATATVTVNCSSAPVITTQPASSTITQGQSVVLSVAASQAVSYQWYTGASPSTATPIAGATGSTLTVTPSTTTSYWVRVTNGCGFANSNTATVCVLPLITAHPTSRAIVVGQSTTLNVTANNATSYQWYVGTSPSTASPIAGATGASVTVTPGATTNYWVRAINSCGSTNSNTATVTVGPVQTPITRVQSAFALANSQTSITASWTQPTQAGSLLVAVISGRKDPNGSVVWTAPAGWILANTEEWTNIKTSIYYIPNAPAGRTSETFTVAAGFHDQTLYLFEYTGIVAASPVDRIATNGDSTNSGYVQTGFTANTTQAKELVITALTTYTPTEFSTVPADGYVELYDKFIGNRLTTAAYQKITSAIGSYGHGATVANPGEQYIGLVVTFKGN
jgi:hypothetical protein